MTSPLQLISIDRVLLVGVMAEGYERNSSEDWSKDLDMQRDDVVEKVEHPFYAVWRARYGSVTSKLRGRFSEFSHDIRQFTDTQRLRVLSTQLASLPHDIRHFREIKCLQIGKFLRRDESLLEMWSFVEEMKQLEELEVWEKRAISDIPQGSCAHLTLLRKLVIRGCGLTSLPHNMGQLTMLQHLDLSYNNLQHLCDSFSSLINLKYLNLSDNPFVALHKELPFKSFTNIITLILWNTNLSLLPSLVSHMTEMEVLYIEGNSVSHLPKQLCDLHKLRYLDTRFNPLVSPPVEVCSGGLSAIRSYFHSLSSSVPVKRQRMKMLVCGKCQAGKTSLARTLACHHSCCTDEAERTIGIEEGQLTLSNGTQLIIIDCGGHRSYLLTNQLLVSDKSVNVVVVDSSEYKLNEEYFRQHVGHYIQMILERCRLGVVLTVFTKADQLYAATDRTAVVQHYVKCVRAMLQLREQQMKQHGMQSTSNSLSVFLSHQNVEIREEVLFVSSLTLEGLDQLYKRLEEVTSTATLLPTLEAEVPETWLAFENRLHYSAQVALGIKEKPSRRDFDLRSTHKQLVVKYSSPIPVWSVKSVTSYGERCGLGKDEAQFVLSYLHQVSSVLYFPRYPSLRLTVFGLVSFVVDVLKVIFRHDHERSLQYDIRFCQHPNAVSPDKFQEMKSNLVHNACLAMPMLLALWSGFKLEIHHLDVFLKLLIQFEFAYIVAGSHVEQTAMMLCNTPCFEDEQSDQEDKHQQSKSEPLESTDVLSEGEAKQPESGNDQ